MSRPGYLLLLALSVVVATAPGQELAPVVLAGPPNVATGVLPEGLPEGADYFNSPPSYVGTEAGFGNEWWCATWYTRVEVLTLARDHDPQDRVLIESNASGTSLLSASDIGFGLAPGVSTLLGHRIDALTAIEMSYFGANQWSYTTTVGSAADLNLSGALGDNLNDFNRANVMEVIFESQLHCAEANYFRDVDGISLLAGLRYLGWHEQLQIHAVDSDLDASDYEVSAGNNLYGGQIGARLARYFHNLDCELTTKAGLFGNKATQSQLLTNLNGMSVVRDFSTTNGGVAFVGDLNLSATCPLGRVYRLRGGYNAMYISGLALAANQLDFSNGPVSGRLARLDADAFIHGFNVGIEAIW